MADEPTNPIDADDEPHVPVAIELHDAESVANQIEEIPAADGADVLKDLTTAQAADVAEYLDPHTASHILAEMEPTLAATIISDMELVEASMVLGEMNPDDRVDILYHLPRPMREELIGLMDAPDAAEVRKLEQYPRDTAGGIMTSQVTALEEHFTVEEAIAELRRQSEQLEQMFYVYVIDLRGHLVGVLSMRDLILARPERKINTLMRTNVSSVPATMDQEEVARIFRKYKYLAMPVVDAKNRLLGLITVDDVVNVINDEATEDVQKMAGAGAEERLTSPWQFSVRARTPWLLVNLGTAFMAAGVVGLFQQTITALPVLAAYQTVVSGMGGNAGAQAMAVTIRGIALGQVDTKLLKRLLKRELIVGVLTGLLVGTITWIIAATTSSAPNAGLIGMVICIALTLNHINACLTGVAIPFVMKRLGFDPAQSATIFATTFTDCGGFFVTLGLASLFMHWIK